MGFVGGAEISSRVGKKGDVGVRDHIKGFKGGVRAGYGKRFNRFLYGGAEAEHLWSDASARVKDRKKDKIVKHKMKREASLSGRLGYLTTERTLLFGLAGYQAARYTDGGKGHWRHGVRAGAGREHVLADKAASRAEVVGSYFPKKKGNRRLLNGSQTVGLSYHF